MIGVSDERHDIDKIPPAARPPSRWLTWAGLASTGVAAMCCIGLSAAVSLVTAVGATFLTRDSALRPVLALSLGVTMVGSALTFWRHRKFGPLALTMSAAIWVYTVIYLVGSGHAAVGHGDHMTDHPAALGHHAAFSGNRLTAVWVGLAALVAAQVWDLIRIRGARTGQREARSA